MSSHNNNGDIPVTTVPDHGRVRKDALVATDGTTNIAVTEARKGHRTTTLTGTDGQQVDVESWGRVTVYPDSTRAKRGENRTSTAHGDHRLGQGEANLVEKAVREAVEDGVVSTAEQKELAKLADLLIGSLGKEVKGQIVYDESVSPKEGHDVGMQALQARTTSQKEKETRNR